MSEHTRRYCYLLFLLKSTGHAIMTWGRTRMSLWSLFVHLVAITYLIFTQRHSSWDRSHVKLNTTPTPALPRQPNHSHIEKHIWISVSHSSPLSPTLRKQTWYLSVWVNGISQTLWLRRLNSAELPCESSANRSKHASVLSPQQLL